MLLRSALTARPVLAGFVPGVTATVNSVELPASTELGVAAPVPLGLVVAPLEFGVSEKSSTARPSSEPVALKSLQRIQNVAPLGMLSPLIVPEMAVRLPAALPSRAATVATFGDEKLSAATVVHVPVFRPVASVLY